MPLTEEQLRAFTDQIITRLNDITFNNIFNYLKDNPSRRNRINPAFPFPKKIRLGILKDCLAIEYIGPEDVSSEMIDTSIEYFPSKDIYEFIGFEIDKLAGLKVPYSDSIINTNFFSGDSIVYLCDYFYDFMQVREDYVVNAVLDIRGVNKPIVLNNCTFFYTDENDGLKIRHIDLLEVFPFKDDDIWYHDDLSLVYFSNYIIYSTFPTYDVILHKKLNDFIQLINLEDTIEPHITKFIEDNPELLQLAFGFNKLNEQKLMIWQDRTGRDNLQPDFLPEDMSGYCNILDFKLPYLKSKAIVGRSERKHPSYEIDECIAQLDTYEEYCSQHVNQQWLESTYEIKIDTPQRFIVMGHSDDFSSEDRQRIRKQRKTTFFTYDEFIEMARFQLYRIK